MKKMKYTPEMKELVEQFLRNRNREMLQIQLILMLSYQIYGWAYYQMQESVSCSFVVFGQLFVLFQIYIIEKWTCRYKEGFFLSERIECLCLVKYAIKKGLSEQWIQQQINLLLEDFYISNGF